MCEAHTYYIRVFSDPTEELQQFDLLLLSSARGLYVRVIEKYGKRGDERRPRPQTTNVTALGIPPKGAEPGGGSAVPGLLEVALCACPVDAKRDHGT